jgi:hypothetical protein
MIAKRKGVRTCGATCHHARSAKCRCWCGGLFHGAAGEGLRNSFRAAMNTETLPTTEQQFRELTGQPSLFGEGLTAGDEWRGRHEQAKEHR